MQNGVGPPRRFNPVQNDPRDAPRVYWPRPMPRPGPELIDLDLGDTDIWAGCSGDVHLGYNDFVSWYRFYDGSVVEGILPPRWLIRWLRMEYEKARLWNVETLETAKRRMTVFGD